LLSEALTKIWALSQAIVLLKRIVSPAPNLKMPFEGVVSLRATKPCWKALDEEK